ncbi:MAG: hypothetical protein F4Y57_09940 [Acidobacteria bacterium]|nr:hypothetical protein [Acidobacteriota bacterium]
MLGARVLRRRDAGMRRDSAAGIQGWLLVYLVCSIPVLLFHSAGLSGWFFDYPIGLWLGIFLVLASPLLLILSRSPAAPRWNIAALWIASILITVRIGYGILFQRIRDGLSQLASEELLEALPLLLGIVIFSLAWATAWTKYFTTSVRVRNTFGK